MRQPRQRVCPVALANSLTHRVRRWLQDPAEILAPYVREGMTVLDVGCGPGFFTVEAARLVGRTGRVIAADLQDGMLNKLRRQIQGTELEPRISLVRCESDRINVATEIDFGLAAWMVHEVPNKSSFFAQLRAISKPAASILLFEPKLLHVSRTQFAATLELAEAAGFAASAGPRLSISWSAVLRPAAGS